MLFDFQLNTCELSLKDEISQEPDLFHPDGV